MKLDQRITFYWSKEDLQALNDWANWAGLSRSEFIREAVAEYASIMNGLKEREEFIEARKRKLEQEKQSEP
jgi:metal-responsive CopG/Arc/MetJ family transcriptional regulator